MLTEFKLSHNNTKSNQQWLLFFVLIQIVSTSISFPYVFTNCSSLTSITSNATTAPSIQSSTFQSIKTGGTLYVPIGSSGYDTWMGTGNYYLGKYNWTKADQ